MERVSHVHGFQTSVGCCAVFLRETYHTHMKHITDDIVCFCLAPAEKGQFLALDLGGSKFKVLQVKVREGMGIRRGGVEMEERTYPIPKELLNGRGTEVWRRAWGTVKSRGTRGSTTVEGTEKACRSCMNPPSPWLSLLSPSLSAAIWPRVRVSEGLPAWEEHQFGEETSSGLHFLFPLWTLVLGSGNDTTHPAGFHELHLSLCVKSLSHPGHG